MENVWKASNNHTAFLSLVIEGADPIAYSLPHFVLSSKNLRGEGFKIKIVGVKRRTSSNDQVMCYVMTEEFETGA